MSSGVRVLEGLRSYGRLTAHASEAIGGFGGAAHMAIFTGNRSDRRAWRPRRPRANAKPCLPPPDSQAGALPPGGCDSRISDCHEGPEALVEGNARHGKVWTARLPGRTLDEITPGELERIRTDRLRVRTAEDGTECRVTAATANREFAFLRHVFNVAIRDDKASSNPVSKLKTLREPSGRTRYLTDDEEERLMKALPSDEDRARVTVLLQTGFRRGELLGLRWRDVDLKGGILTIPKAKNGEARHVPLTSTVRTLLSHRPRSLDSSALVFPNREGHCDLRSANRSCGSPRRSDRGFPLP